VKDPSGYPGVTRIDMNENCDGYAVAWESGEAFCAVVLKLSAGSGLESVRDRKCVWQKRNRNVEGLQKKSFAVRFFVQQIRYTAFAAEKKEGPLPKKQSLRVMSRSKGSDLKRHG